MTHFEFQLSEAARKTTERATAATKWMLAHVGLCRHQTMLRERIDGIPHYVCDDCGYTVPILRRVK